MQDEDKEAIFEYYKEECQKKGILEKDMYAVANMNEAFVSQVAYSGKSDNLTLEEYKKCIDEFCEAFAKHQKRSTPDTNVDSVNQLANTLISLASTLA